MMSYITVKFRKVTKIKKIGVTMMSYITVKFRNVTKIRNSACDHDVIYNG